MQESNTIPTTTDESYTQGWLDAYEGAGYRLDHSGAPYRLSLLEEAYIDGFNAGEEARNRDVRRNS